MLQELDVNEMEMVSGGTDQREVGELLQIVQNAGSEINEIVVTGTRSAFGGVPRNPDPFGFVGVSGGNFLTSIGLGLGGETELTGTAATNLLDTIDRAEQNGVITTTTTTTIEIETVIKENEGTIRVCVDTFFGCIDIANWP